MCMRARLGQAARAARTKAGLTLLDIATRADVSEVTIHRFETTTRWPQQTDRIVAAYAHELGIDWRELWQQALDA